MDFHGVPNVWGRPLRPLGDSYQRPTDDRRVCAAELVVGFLLWTGRTSGLWTARALLLFEFFYWIGFAPLGPDVGVLRTVLVVVAISQR